MAPLTLPSETAIRNGGSRSGPPQRDPWRTSARRRDQRLAGTPVEPEAEIWGLPNVIVSPGLAGDNSGKWQAQHKRFAENMHRYLAGDELVNAIDKELGY